MTKRRSRRHAAPLAIAAGIIAVGGVLALAQGTRHPAAAPAVQVSRGRAAQPAVQLAADTARERRPLAFYTGSVRGDLFAQPAPPAPAPAAPPAAPSAMPALPPAAPAELNPFSDFAYSGTVEANGELMALVENTKTREGQYLKVGDPFLGGSVTRISDRALVVSVAGVDRTLAKTDNYKLTPLEKSAPYLTAQPQPQPGQATPNPAPGGPASGGPLGAAMGNWMDRLPPEARARIQERINSLTPEQRERIQNRWMNRQFERGDRGGRRRFWEGGQPQ